VSLNENHDKIIITANRNWKDRLISGLKKTALKSCRAKVPCSPYGEERETLASYLLDRTG
jgi:hypothetical protein